MKNRNNRSRIIGSLSCALAAVLFLVPSMPAGAQVVPKDDSALRQKIYRHPDLYIRQGGKAIGELAPALATKATADLALLGGQSGYYDLRSGRWSLLVMSRPLVSASGVTAAAAKSAVLSYVAQFQAQLGILPTEVGTPRVTVFDGGRVVQFHAPRVVNGVPVRDAWLKATLNSGKIVLMGTQNWAPATIATQPVLSANDAASRVRSHAGTPLTLKKPPELVIVPLEKGDDPGSVAVGDGETFRLAWAVTGIAAGDDGTWEGLVDAQSGELIAFLDVNQYSQVIKGGIFPVSNDGQAPDGVEQPGFPMPFANVTGTNAVTNSSGVATGVGHQLRTDLSGPYVRINDRCGPIDESSVCSSLDMSVSPGHNCDVPTVNSSPGNTHAARTGFYELNRQIEGWRNRLPAGATAQAWLNSQVTSNMNIDNTCNAFWNGSSVNFYREGGGCGNTGEIAAVFDHEWGHGLDNNGTDNSISSPGEAIADIYGILRLTDSCFGRGFFLDGACGGYGNPCTQCTGVREADYTKHECAQPYDITWINQVGYPVADPLCVAPVAGVTPGHTAGGCIGFASGQVGPCGQETHCEGNVPAQATYDLFARDLQGAGGLTNYGFNTALEITTRLIAIAADNLANWYTCTQGAGGCTTMTGYNMLLAADDDNGNLADGTPHMQAIFNAFNRHGIACTTPTALNAGCAGAPAVAPTLNVAPGANSATLTWNAVAGASKYAIYRTEGVKGCNFGKTPIGQTTGTTFTDTGLREGFPLLYTVLPVGSSDACIGRMAVCQSVTPTAASSVADAGLLEAGNSLAIQSGSSDGDVFLDNCEQATLTFKVENSGSVPLNNVRITSVELVGKPSSDVLTSLPLPVASTIPVGCPSSQPILATIAFRPQGLNFDETLQVRVTLMANELAQPRVATVLIRGTESNFQPVASKTFSFETDLEGWKVVSGTFTRMPVGANATANGLYSSSAKDNQCDNIQSPEIRLKSNSTLSLYNQFSTEPESPLGTYDRANVGLFDVGSGSRTTILPTGGRAYSYPPGTSGGTCVTENQAGWATTPTTPGVPFAQSSWNAAALGLPASAGKRLRIDVGYGTDPTASGAGFQFDEVTITNFDLQVPDQASNTCTALPPPARPDLRVTSMTTGGNQAREGDKVTVTATVRNEGTASAGTSQTEFRLDNTTILGRAATGALAAGATTNVSIQWDTRNVKGAHTLYATADAALAVSESNENNNTSSLAVTVQGNKVKNGSFEASNASANGPDGWSGSSTGAGSATWSDGGSDGSKSASTSGNGGSVALGGSPSWTSDPIAVTPGQVLTFAVSVSSVNASSAATAGLAYLGSAGNVLSTVNLITAPLTTAGFTRLQQSVTIPAGVSSVRVKLTGFAPGDTHTAGTVAFDDVGLFGN
jgi:CARDB protein